MNFEPVLYDQSDWRNLTSTEIDAIDFGGLSQQDIDAIISSGTAEASDPASSEESSPTERHNLGRLNLLLATNTEMTEKDFVQSTVNAVRLCDDHDKPSAVDILIEIAEIAQGNSNFTPELQNSILTEYRRIVVEDPDLLFKLRQRRRYTPTKDDNVAFTSMSLSSGQAKLLQRAHYTQADLDPNDVHADELRTMAWLYENDPTSIQRLFHDYGIRHFSWHDPNQLLSQLDHRPEPAQPIVMIASCVDDWNSHAIGAVYEATQMAQEAGAHVVSYQFSSVYGIMKALVHNRRQRPAPDSIVIVTHGDEHGILVGYADGTLTNQEILDGSNVSKKLGKITCIKPTTSVALTACSIGGRGKFAHALNKTTGLEVKSSYNSSSVVAFSPDKVRGIKTRFVDADSQDTATRYASYKRSNQPKL